MKYYKFQLFVDCNHLCFDLFLPNFRFSLLTSIEFPIYPRLLYLNPVESFHIIIVKVGITSWNFNPGWKSPYNQPLKVFLGSIPGFKLLSWSERRVGEGSYSQWVQQNLKISCKCVCLCVYVRTCMWNGKGTVE